MIADGVFKTDMAQDMEKTIREKLEGVHYSEKDISKLYEIFNSIEGSSIPIIRFYIDEGAWLIRQRINKSGKEFKNISELSYPPVEYCNYGRANIPFHPMFYCCSFATDMDAPEPRYTTLLETSAFIMDKETIGVERATCSRWDVIEKLNLLALPFSKNYKRTFDDITQIQEEWNKEVKKTDINKSALELIEYMSEEIAKEATDNIQYFKIANFIFYLLFLNPKTKESDGIIYPSVAAAGEGFNVVLKPEVVDRKLKFYAAALCYLVKNKMQARLDVVSQAIGCSDEGNLTFEPEKDLDISKYKNYVFIN